MAQANMDYATDESSSSSTSSSSSSPSSSSSSSWPSIVTFGVKRLLREYKQLMADPPTNIVAHPLEDNIFVWNFVLRGHVGTPSAGGSYHGKLLFPPTFPFQAPCIYFFTPSGLCFELCPTDFYGQQWDPSWTVSSLLLALLSNMTDKALDVGSLIELPKWKAFFPATIPYNALQEDIFYALYP